MNMQERPLFQKLRISKDFLAVQLLGFHDCTAKRLGSIPSWGTKIPQATWRGQNNWEFQDEDSRRLNKGRGSPEQATLWDYTGDHCEAGPEHKTLSAYPGVWFSGKGPQLSRSWPDKVKNQCLWGWVKVPASCHHLFSPCGQAVRYTGWPGGGPGDREERTRERWRLGCCWWTRRG